MHIRAGVCVSWTFYWGQNKSNTIFPIRFFLCTRVKVWKWAQCRHSQIPAMESNSCADSSSLTFMEICFVIQDMAILGEFYLETFKCLFCSCWLIVLFISSIPCWYLIGNFFHLQRGMLKSFAICHLFSW